MSLDDVAETFLKEGRIDHFDVTLSKKIMPTSLSWLALWVVKAFRQGIMSPKIDERLYPDLSCVFVDDRAISPTRCECEAIETRIREEFSCCNLDTLIIDPPHVFLAYCHGIEKALLSHTNRLLSADPSLPIQSPEQLMAVNDDQYRAIKGACDHTVFLITGGPGTGKTYTAGHYLQHVAKQSPLPLRVALVAPTGRAVQALETSITRFVSDSVSIFSHTIHSLIRSQQHLPFHLMILDECSMIDSDLMLKLFERIHSGMRILMLGDADQLPPIEPGRPFEKMIASFPCYRLNKCQRTDVKDILSLASVVCHGDEPRVREALLKESKEISFYNCQTHEQWKRFHNVVAEHVISVWKDASTEDLSVLKSSVCLTPIRKGPFGTESINEMVSKQLLDKEIEPVVVCKNIHTLRLMNGELGLLEKRREQIRFTENTIPLPLCPHIEKAYAMTVHKSQGSEFDTVVFVLPPKAHVDRKLLYTAITRAKRRLIIVADIEDLCQIFR